MTLTAIKLTARMLPFASTLFLLGCRSLGPGTVASGGFDYSQALSESWKRTMLLNLVKTRYLDAPIFLDVSSVINQYEMVTDVNVGATAVSSSPNDSLSIGGRRTYSDRPTITYSPLSGERFTRSMMTPIPVTSLLYLIQAGTDLEATFVVGVKSVNGIENRVTSDMGKRDADPRFSELIALLGRLQDCGDLDVRAAPGQDTTAVVMELRESSARDRGEGERQADIDRVKQILGLDPAESTYAVVYGSRPESDQEITILTRSMLLIMGEFASWVEVPDADVTEGRVRPSAVPGTGPMAAPIQVRCSAEAPLDAFVAVPYRGHYFWIDDRDTRSKRALSFLMLYHSLTETSTRANAPIVTIPAN